MRWSQSKYEMNEHASLSKLVLLIFVLLQSNLLHGAESAPVREIHAKVITPASEALYAAETEIPGTDHAWDEIQGIAKELAKAGTTLAAAGTKSGDTAWQKLTVTLREEAENAARAAAKHNHEALVAANAKIVAACDACHRDYRK